MSLPNRRAFLFGASAAALLPASAFAGSNMFEVTRSEAEWRAMLTNTQYLVMREEATEIAYFSPLHANKEPGVYTCRGCDLPLYSSTTKFDSLTGWPSFTSPIKNAVGTRPDNTLFIYRTEVHCRRCGSHLGHIFNDGPAPTGERHCLNGSSLIFIAA